MVKNVDLIVLGGGTGGYVAAIRAAQQGRHVTLIEDDKLGGTCLHQGCIPTKSFLKSAKVLDDIANSDEYGIELAAESLINLEKVIKRKQTIVDQLHQGIQSLMKQHKVDVIHGRGVVQGPSIFTPDSGGVAVEFHDPDIEEEIFVPKHLIIATGSHPIALPNLPFDHKYILSSEDMLELRDLPERLAIIGGGVIGCEWATIMNSFGCQVTVIEAMDRILPTESKRVSKALTKEFKQRGMDVRTQHMLEEAKIEEDKVILTFKDQEESLEVDQVLVAIGRAPNVEGMGLNNTSIQYDAKGIKVNNHYQTAEPHIYAIGDVIPTLQLAHVAMKEAELAVEHIMSGKSDKLNYPNVPRCTYTHPEIASVGYNKENLPEGMEVSTGIFKMNANGKALIEGDASNGFVEILKDKKTGDVIGASIVGPHATDLIAEVSTAMYMNAAPIEIGEAIHPHPTISEAIQEAALDVEKMAIHK